MHASIHMYNNMYVCNCICTCMCPQLSIRHGSTVKYTVQGFQESVMNNNRQT